MRELVGTEIRPYVRSPEFPTANPRPRCRRGMPRADQGPLSTVRASGSSGRWTAVASLLLPTHVEIVLRFPVDDVARRPLGKFQLPRPLAVTDVR